jgi:transcriptional regulator with XRE-family HTH domain
MDLQTAIAQVLRQIRKEHRLSIRFIQDEYDISKVTLSKWENNRALISITSLEIYMRRVYRLHCSDVLLRAEALLEEKYRSEGVRK